MLRSSLHYMKLLFWLKMHHPEMAVAEIRYLLDASAIHRRNDVVLADVKRPEEMHRLALSRAVFEPLFECSEKKLFGVIDSFRWRDVVKGTVAFNVHHSAVSAKALADRIWHWLENPKADLRHPQTSIHFFYEDGCVHCGRRVWQNPEGFEERKPHLRLKHYPISCHPRLSRVMVNLTGAPKGGRIYDPFCGTGGMLIEAGLMGLKPVGSDLNALMVRDALANCEQAGVACSITVKDATMIYAPEKYVVADLPYGRQSGLKTEEELKTLYSAFLNRLQDFLRCRAVLSFPSSVSKLLKDTSLKCVASFDDYVHASLCRRIVVLEQK